MAERVSDESTENEIAVFYLISMGKSFIELLSVFVFQERNDCFYCNSEKEWNMRNIKIAAVALLAILN